MIFADFLLQQKETPILGRFARVKPGTEWLLKPQVLSPSLSFGEGLRVRFAYAIALKSTGSTRLTPGSSMVMP